MKKKLKVLCIIPARKGSKGIKLKNLEKINNKPLIYYPIAAAKKSKVIDLLKKYDFTKISEKSIYSVSIFSNLKASDLLFVKLKTQF